MDKDYPCICGRRFTTERGVKIHRTKKGCLNASTIQQQRTAQARSDAGKLKPGSKPQVLKEIHANESDEEFRQLINAKRQRINFPPSRAEVPAPKRN